MIKKIKALIFDVGGVLFLAKNKRKRNEKNLLSSFEEACNLVKEENLNLKENYNLLKEVYLKSTRDKLSDRETFAQISKILKVSPQRVKKIFEEAYRKNIIENKDLYSYIIKLKDNGYKIAISSIQSSLSKDILIPRKYYKEFDALQISCEDGFRKPEKQAFEFILKRLRVKPEESVFIDDKEENLIPAKKLGIKIVLFKNNSQFINDLKALKVKIK